MVEGKAWVRRRYCAADVRGGACGLADEVYSFGGDVDGLLFSY